ncbi:MAG: class I SAM-dependent methyltransferase [Candidatus Aureabacteria bacterium]|nr:class I SAM-dependent methyltransferase [Candidatus Auribacterota bacterium]
MQDKHLYHLAVDWEKRLSNELPFFYKIFKENDSEKILDCACGTGHHVIALARLGFSASGSDIDPMAIRIAREKAKKEKVSALFSVADFSNLREYGFKDYDAVFCVGNSFSLAGSLKKIARSFLEIHAVLRDGGLFIFQVLNYPRIFRKRDEWVPAREVDHKKRTHLFLKRFRAKGKRISVLWIHLWREKDKWKAETKESLLLPLPKSWIACSLKKAGFRKIRFFGSYQSEKIVPDSRDIIVVCQKR